MVEGFTRWTAPCGCVFELISDPDSSNLADRENRFAMCDYICPKHERHRTKSLIKSQSSPNHKTKADRIMKTLEQIKQRNIQSHENIIATANKGTKRYRELLPIRPLIEKHNEDIHNEWTELTTNDHAFDEELYNIVLKEHQFREVGPGNG